MCKPVFVPAGPLSPSRTEGRHGGTQNPQQIARFEKPHAATTADFTFQTANFKQPSLIARILYRGPGQARLPFPLQMRGDGAPGGRSSSVSAPPCEDAEAPPGAPPEHLSMPGLICGRLHSASPTVVNGTCCAGLRFPGAVCGQALTAVPRQPAPARRLVVAAGRGHRARPGCVGGAFVSRPRAPHPAPSPDASR